MNRTETRRRRRDAALAATRDRADRRRRAAIGLSLAGILAVQIAMTWHRLGAPFLDTRLHYSYDNALYGFQIRNGIRDGDFRSQFGVTVNAYDRWGETVDRASYYTDHPFLMKALLQLYARAVGVSEWTTRSFYLLVAGATVAGLYTVVVLTTGDLFAAAAAAGTLVALPLFAVYQVCVKSEADGMLFAVWIYVAFLAYLERGSRAVRLAYAALLIAAFLTHWTAILFVGVLGAVQLFLARRLPRARELLTTTAEASAGGLLALLALMSYLQRGWSGAWAALTRAFAVRSQPVHFADWSARQVLYLQKNFTMTAAVACFTMLGLLAARLWRRRRAKAAAPSEVAMGLPLLGAFIGTTTAVASLWVFLFPQGSYIHVYWQYWFCLPIAALVAATVAATGTSPISPWVARAAAAALVAALLFSAQRAWAGIAADELGTPDDIAFLQTLREDRFPRLVFVPLTESPLNDWFQGPLFLYYTDRPVQVATRPEEVRAGDKLLVLRYTNRALAAGGLERWSGRRLKNEKCGLRICAYDVE